MLVNIPTALEEKDALVHVRSEDDYIHTSWHLKDGKVIACEAVHDGGLSVAILLWDNIQEYKENIKEIPWIAVNTDLVEMCHDCGAGLLPEEVVYRAEDGVLCSECGSTFKIIRDDDPNQEYYLESNNPEDAALEAVERLGWTLAEERKQ